MMDYLETPYGCVWLKSTQKIFQPWALMAQVMIAFYSLMFSGKPTVIGSLGSWTVE